MRQNREERFLQEGGKEKMKKYLTPKEVSEIYSLSEKWLANMRWEKKWIPYLKVGGKILYRPEDIENFIEKHQIKIISE